MTACPICEANRADLGRPSAARWIGPDGEPYCSMHFINRFGHSEPLVKIGDYVAPTEVKKPAPKNGRRKKKEAVK
jgi:hypothetical protein